MLQVETKAFVHFLCILQRFVAQREYSRPCKGPRKDTTDLLLRLPISSFGDSDDDNGAHTFHNPSKTDECPPNIFKWEVNGLVVTFCKRPLDGLWLIYSIQTKILEKPNPTLCSPNEDFRRSNEAFDDSFRSTFQGCDS
jgi:hypothetical protein